MITGALGRDPRECTALARLADRFALPVVPFNPRHLAMSSRHPMFQGGVAGRSCSPRPIWSSCWKTTCPGSPAATPAAGARMVQIGEDPLYARYPMRSFRSDLTLAANLGVLARTGARAGAAP